MIGDSKLCAWKTLANQEKRFDTLERKRLRSYVFHNVHRNDHLDRHNNKSFAMEHIGQCYKYSVDIHQWLDLDCYSLEEYSLEQEDRSIVLLSLTIFAVQA